MISERLPVYGQPLPTTPRWHGVLGTVAAAAALVGIVLGGVVSGDAGSATISQAPWELWIGFGALAVCVLALRGVQALAAADALGVAAAWLCVPTLFLNVQALPGTIQRLLRQAPGEDMGGLWITLGLLVLGVGAGVLGIIIMFSDWRRWSSPRTADLPRSPFRVEVLVLVGAFAVLVGLQGVMDLIPGRVNTAWVLAFVVPVTVSLAFALRRSGWGSVWVAGALAAVVFVDVVRLLGHSESQGWSTSSLGWADVLLVPLIAVLMLWNASKRPPVVQVDGREMAEPLHSWAGVAFILAFVPLLSIPAIIIGHVAYEQVVASSRISRGRIFAAAAIVIGLLNLFIVIAVYFGLLSLVNGFVSGLSWGA